MTQILFEDRDVVAINKPINIPVIPTHTKGEETVLSNMQELYENKLFVVHRLDKEVSGVMLFAKNAMSHRSLNRQFFERTVRKTYHLVAIGSLENDSGTIDKPIRQFGSGRMGVDEITGKPSVTVYSVIERTDRFTFVKAIPGSGRRHQIRVHFYSIGHPICGDMHYGDKKIQKKFPRLMLHASEVTFRLMSGEEKTVAAELPGEFKGIMGK
jgi:tRNA pseudouridine32 synthase / 23S rRNA pseudouridine746 synthase